MKALEELYNAPSCNFVKYPLCTNYVQCLQYLQVLKYSSAYKYLAKYLSISTSTLGKLRKYLSKVQVLSNLYLSVLKCKYSCTWPHVWYMYSVEDEITVSLSFSIPADNHSSSTDDSTDEPVATKRERKRTKSKKGGTKRRKRSVSTESGYFFIQ